MSGENFQEIVRRIVQPTQIYRARDFLLSLSLLIQLRDVSQVD